MPRRKLVCYQTVSHHGNRYQSGRSGVGLSLWIVAVLIIGLLGGGAYQVFFTGDLLPTWLCHEGADQYGIPRCPISANYIAAQPESQLVYPGARVVSRDQEDEKVGLDANSMAHVTSRIEARASSNEVISWYKEQLASHQWGFVSLTLPPYYAWNRHVRESIQIQVISSRPGYTLYSYDYSITTGGWRG